MAFSSSSTFILVFFASSLLLHAAFGEVICEELPTDKCAFSIASSGKRCLLEKYVKENGETEYQCKTSEVIVEKMSGYIETDQCVSACGLDRNNVGISSDSLLETQFTAKLCSPQCYNNCPNIIDLYFNLAAGEGVFLPDLCEAQRFDPHRSMIELLSSGAVSGTPAPGPQSSSLDDFASTPQSSPISSPIFGADTPALSPM